jgi:hypothetical protein
MMPPMSNEQRASLAALALVTAMALAPPARAQECFPTCRSGYVCHEGACISLCNPPCADDERCTPEGECAVKERAVPPAPAAAIPPAPAPAPAPAAAPAPEEPPRDRGIAFGFSLGAATCVSGNAYACNTSDGDAGLLLSLRGGYRLLPWLFAGVDVSLVPLFYKGVSGANLQLDTSLGARFYPLARRHRVDLVLGLQVGYAMLYSGAETSGTKYSMAHGVVVAYGVGVDFKLAEAFSLGLALDVFEPFWLASCTRFPAVEYDIESGTGGTSERTTCSDYAGDYDQLFFGAGLSGSFLL